MVKKENAVSPVVGVLLMLVVTIIIAAIVSGFAGGLATGQVKAPQASFDIKTGFSSYDPNVYDISIIHRGGDSVPSKDLKIVTALTLPNGTIVKHEQTALSKPIRQAGTVDAPKYQKTPWVNDKFKNNEYGYRLQNEIDAVGFVPPGSWYGEFAFTDGISARTYKTDATAAFLGLVNESSWYPAIDADYTSGKNILLNCINNHTSVNFQFVHIPSSKIILDKTITLEGA